MVNAVVVPEDAVHSLRGAQISLLGNWSRGGEYNPLNGVVHVRKHLRIDGVRLGKGADEGGLDWVPRSSLVAVAVVIVQFGNAAPIEKRHSKEAKSENAFVHGELHAFAFSSASALATRAAMALANRLDRKSVVQGPGGDLRG